MSDQTPDALVEAWRELAKDGQWADSTATRRDWTLGLSSGSTPWVMGSAMLTTSLQKSSASVPPFPAQRDRRPPARQPRRRNKQPRRQRE
jgi:hypothetical protein